MVSLVSIPLVSWVNGTIMIGVFVAVVIGLVLAVFSLIKTDKKPK